MKKYIFLWVCLFHITSLTAQDLQPREAYLPSPPDPEFFKYIPLVDQHTPDWATMMYGDHPNVNEVEAAYVAYFEQHPFQKSIHTQNYKHWRRTIHQSHYVLPNGYIRLPDYEQERQELADHLSRRAAARNGNSGSWVALGPFETQAAGGNQIVTWQSNIYTIDQSASDPNTIYAGTETGGVFKSTDKGMNWISIGDELVLGGIGSIKVDPTNASTVYLAQGRYLYKSTNGGSNWTEILNIWNLNIRDIHINTSDPNIVLLASPLGLYRSTNGGGSFTQILTDGCYDVETKPDDPSVYYIAKENTSLNLTEVWKATDWGVSFTPKTSGWFVPTNGTAASNGGARLAVTPADPDYLYCALLGSDVSYQQDNNWVGVYKSTNAGESWLLPAGEAGGPYDSDHWCLSSFHPTFAWGGNYDQGFYNLGIAVSHTDPESFLIGCLNLFKSENGGETYEQWGGYGGGPGWQHPDIQEIEINGSDVWVACDGGLNLYASDWNSLSARMSGINSSEYWGFDAGWNEDVLVGGRYHNGNGGYYENYPSGSFIRLGGAESPTGYVNPGNNREVYHSDIGGKLLPTSISGAVENITDLGLYPNQAIANENKSEIVADPRCYNHWYMGSGNSIFKSEDGGISSTILNSFGSGSDLITGIEISRNNPDVIYAAQRLSGAATIWKSTDGGETWTNLNPSFSGSGGGGIFISVDQANENNIWAALSNGGSSSNKVYRSTNGGSSWTNITGSALSGHWPEDIMMQSGTNGGVYLATHLGIFYRNDSHSDWQDFSTGAPAKMANMTLKPFYRDGKIRSATYNRGIWESDFYEPSSPIVQPMVDKTHSDCARDIFYFDDYSILNHTNASWSWTFSPYPESVSSTEVRNPEVIFGQAGSYTATLTVTQGSFSDSESIIITVADGCDAETLPGNALTLGGGSSDFVAADPLGVVTNEFTISMWIKRDGDQNDWAGLFFQRGNSDVGLNFGTDNELRYHPGWPWNSGLVVPDDEWTHVAMVMSPSSVTLYMNGMAAVHNTPQSNQSWTSAIRLGADANFSTRRFQGLMDEVCFYDRAMTQDEIRELMHLTRNPLTDADLLLYYQFNELAGQAYDRSGINHGTLSGGASRQTSIGPFGGGRSSTNEVTSGGFQTFAGGELEMIFPSSGTYPDGDLVVSKIDNAPDQYAGTDPVPQDGYWIVNNYGQNQTFTSLESIRFLGLTGISPNPEGYNLHKRPSNADGDTWGLGLSQATESTSTSLTFEESGISSFSQFIIEQSSALPVDLLQFGAAPQSDKTVRVFWKTINERGSSDFEIEWSRDGQVFSKIGQLPSQGQDFNAYEYIHQEPIRGNNYYRLKQVDLSGEFTYSPIRRVLFDALPYEFVVYPNPIQNEDWLNIRSAASEPYQFTVWNTNGQRVMNESLQGDARIRIRGLQSGVYFYQIQLADKRFNGSLTVGR